MAVVLLLSLCTLMDGAPTVLAVTYHSTENS
jgi:hypothetical protein